MYDCFNRHINYLRISVTDRCNLRCTYCMPEEGISLISHDDVLSFEEILEVTKAAVDMGVNKVRITGGEPLVRHGLISLVEMLSTVKGIQDLGMTTNGVLLDKFAVPLRDAGLHRVNISLDTINPEHFAALTRGGDLSRVLAGIEAAKAAGLEPIKLNCVIHDSPDEEDAREVAAFAEAKGHEIRYIRRMDLAAGHFATVIGGTGGSCEECNRLRLSSDGFIRPCLFSDLGFNIRDLGPAEAIRQAAREKPESGLRSSGAFHAIGG